MQKRLLLLFIIRTTVIIRDVRMVWSTKLLGRPEPPFRTGLCFTRDVSFFVSPLVLRPPSTDRPETLPHGRNLAEFYNPTPKIRGRGAPPKKFGGQKHAKFRSILDHFIL